MVAAGNGRDGLAIEVTTAKAEEMGTTHAETDGGLGGVEGTGVEGVEGAMDEVLGQAVADLALFFMVNFKRRASPWGLPDGGVSFCSNPNTLTWPGQ